jgi:hypothetical protein
MDKKLLLSHTTGEKLTLNYSVILVMVKKEVFEWDISGSPNYPRQRRSTNQGTRTSKEENKDKMKHVLP